MEKLRTIFLIAIVGLLFYSCSSSEDSKLELFTPEAFAYDVGGSWELHVTTIAKGFEQKKSIAKYEAKLNYSLDLITPRKDTVKSLVSGVEERSEAEPLEDIELEAQTDLDSTFSDGNYIVIIKVKDELSNQSARITKKFNLSNK